VPEQCLHEPGQRCHVRKVTRHRRTIEVRAEGNVVYSDEFGDVIDMRDHVAEAHILRSLGSRAEKADMEIDAEEATLRSQRTDLLVGQVPWYRTQSPTIGMTGHDWLRGALDDVPESGIVQVRDVDQDTELVARSYQCPAEIGQPSSAIVGADSFGIDVRATPGQPQRTQTEPIAQAQHSELGIDRLRSLEVQDRTERPVAKAALEFSDIRDQLHPATRRSDHLQQPVDRAQRPRERLPGKICVTDEHGAEHGRHVATSRSRQIHVAAVALRQEITPSFEEGKHVIGVPVDDREHRHPPAHLTHQRCEPWGNGSLLGIARLVGSDVHPSRQQSASVQPVFQCCRPPGDHEHETGQEPDQPHR